MTYFHFNSMNSIWKLYYLKKKLVHFIPLYSPLIQLHLLLSYPKFYCNKCHRASLVAQRLKHLPALQETWVQSPGRENPRVRKILRLGWSPGEGNGNPLQYSCLENPMDGGAWWAIVHGVAKSGTRLSDFTLLYSLLLYIPLWTRMSIFFTEPLKVGFGDYKQWEFSI